MDRIVDKTRVERVWPASGPGVFADETPLINVVNYLKMPHQDASPAILSFANALDLAAPADVKRELRDRAVMICASKSEEHEARRRGLIVGGVAQCVMQFVGVQRCNMDVANADISAAQLHRVAVLLRHIANSLGSFRQMATHEGERVRVADQISDLWRLSMMTLDEAISIGPMGLYSEENVPQFHAC